MKPEAYDHIPDADLLEHYYADKNTEWIGVLLQRYTVLLLGVCMKYMKNEEEARDCVQQVFLKVLTDLQKHKVDFFKSWLYTVAKNHCLMKLRGQQGKAAKELTDNTVAVPHTDETQQLQENEKTYALLEQAIVELSEEQRQCVILFYLQKQSYQQISEKTGYSLMQVKSYIQNGKRNLKLLMEKKAKAT
ncbi:MAG: RNA polymerase sigma factor [Chitinophagaceae bacterium]